MVVKDTIQLSFTSDEGNRLLELLLHQIKPENLSEIGPIFNTFYRQIREQGAAGWRMFELHRIRPLIIQWLQLVFDEFQSGKHSHFVDVYDQGLFRKYLTIRDCMDYYNIQWSDLGVEVEDAEGYLNWRRRYLHTILSKYGIEVLTDRATPIDQSDFPELFASTTVIKK